MRHRLGRTILARASLLLLCAGSLSGCVAAVADGIGDVGNLVGGPGSPVRACRSSSHRPDPRRRTARPMGRCPTLLPRSGYLPGHEAGHLETASFGSPNQQHDFSVLARRSLDEATFGNEIASHISGRIGSNRDVLLFVHGFNTGFDEARFRLAQIVTDGGFNGIPVLFTWPSKGSLFGYGSDREAATASRDALERVIRDLASEPDIGKIHVLAHSMEPGSPWRRSARTPLRAIPISTGISATSSWRRPTSTSAVFRQQVARLGSYAHVSVFASSNDRALTLSGIMADRPRVGAVDATSPEGRRAIEGLGVHVIDLSRDSVGWIGHATYASAPKIIQGIGSAIAAPRPEDHDTQAVLDGSAPASASLSERNGTVEASPLPALKPAPATPTP